MNHEIVSRANTVTVEVKKPAPSTNKIIVGD
jgi:hypothetical protein